MSAKKQPKQNGPSPQESQPTTNQSMVPTSQIRAWMKQAKQGDEQALAKLSETLAANREAIRNFGGDLCRNTEKLHTTAVSGDKFEMTIAVRAQLDLLRNELSHDNDTETERLMIERVVTCWLTLHTLEQEAAIQYVREPMAPPKLDKAVNRAHRRYIAAIEALDRIRRAKLPLAIDLLVDAQLSAGSRETSALDGPEIIDS